MSGFIEPAAFVIRTGMTSRDIRGAYKMTGFVIHIAGS